MPNPGLLQVSLDAAIPLWQIQISERFASREEAIAYLAEHASGLRELFGSEDILYKSTKPGDSAKAFNALAEAVALMSLMPGGVRVFGRQWIFPEHLWDN